MDFLIGRFSDPFVMLWAPAQRLYWLYLCTAAAFALVVFRRQGARLSLAGFARFVGPRKIYLHRSALLDYGYFVVNRIAFGLLLLPPMLMLSLALVSATTHGIQALLGSPGAPLAADLASMLAQTLLSAVAVDLGLFVAHYLQHRVPFLWEFHKVHHSAAVLTPVTAYRMHPVDDLLSLACVAAFGAVVFGVFDYLQPGNAGELTVLGLNAVIFVFYVAAFNLRHSHVWLSYGRVLNRLFVSPAQHQIHHSAAPHHAGKNFGFIFAFWDTLFGTLYLPQRREELSFGLPDGEATEYSSIRRLYFLPFAKNAGTPLRAASAAVLATLLTLASAASLIGMSSFSTTEVPSVESQSANGAF